MKCAVTATSKVWHMQMDFLLCSPASSFAVLSVSRNALLPTGAVLDLQHPPSMNTGATCKGWGRRRGCAVLPADAQMRSSSAGRQATAQALPRTSAHMSDSQQLFKVAAVAQACL